MEYRQKSLGSYLKGWRQSRGLKLKDLAARTGLSIGFLSKIENGTANPSVDNIQKICYALEITPNDLLTPKNKDELLINVYKNSSYVLKNTERCLLYDFSGNVRLESIFEGNSHFKVNAMTLTGNAQEQYSAIYSYDELGIVASGSMSVTFEDETEYILNQGDALMLRANQHHTVACISEKDCVSYWVEIVNNNN